MPNPWTGIGNPYTRTEVIERLRDTLSKNEPIIVAGAGTGISAKFIEEGGADLIIIYASGRFRMMGHGSIAGMMAYGDANAISMEIGEFEVLPVVKEIPVICGVHASDPRRRMWHFLQQVKAMGFSGINNFPTHSIIDGQFGQSIQETNMGMQKEIDCVKLATSKMDIFSIVYVATPAEAKAMAEAGADVVIAHVGCTVGGSIGVSNASIGLDQAAKTTQAICEAAHSVNKDIMVLSHGGPILTPCRRRLHQRAHRHRRLRRRILHRAHRRGKIHHRAHPRVQIHPAKTHQMKTIAVLGTLDTKGAEHAFLADFIREKGHCALLIDVGTSTAPTVTPDITREDLAASAGIDLAPLIARQDRGECVVAISQAAPSW